MCKIIVSKFIVLFLIISCSFTIAIQDLTSNDNYNFDTTTVGISDDVLKLDLANNENLQSSNGEELKKVSKNNILSDEKFQHLLGLLSKIKNINCRNDINTTLYGIMNGRQWALQMYDSSVKVPFGIEHGSVYQFGSFDECLNSDDVIEQDYRQYHQRIKPKYCLADVQVDGLALKALASRTYQPKNFTIVHWGVCVPKSCSAQDIEGMMMEILGYKVHVDEGKCTIQTKFEMTKGMIIYACIVFCFILMVLISTCCHLHMIYKDDIMKKGSETNCEMIIKAFSIIENLKKLFQHSNDALGLNAINGVKATSMIFIVLGHALLYIVGGPVFNSDFFAVDVKRVQNAFLLNSPLFVDTFLLLSGFLFCRILLKELERRKGKINFLILYICRYIRLTPAYLAVIAFYATWFPKIGDGPLWNNRIGIEQQRCDKSWWVNLLYINNYIGVENLCMFQSWYLSVDTQLFILAPIAIYLLWKSRKWGVGLLGVLLVITTFIPIFITYYKELDPTILVYADEITDISSNSYFINNYMKTHMRATAYVCGLIVGYMLHLIQEKNIKFSKSFVNGMWLFSAVTGLVSMFSITVFLTSEYTALESALYSGLHKLGWSILTGWVIIACSSGHAGFLKTFLASRFFAPISRLTYCAYLSNGIVELYETATLREPVYMSHVSLTGLAFTHTLFTFILALGLCLIFESPIHGIEKIFLRRDHIRRQQEERKENGRTPSTSEETA